MKNQDALNNVRRKVAEVMKKEGDKLIFGWRGEAEPQRKEGDVWEDVNGRTWTLKNGIKQTVTKLDDAKTPWWCPKCSKPLNHRHDIKFWRIRGHCMDCNVKFETQLRREGKWEAYERKIMLRNYVAELRDKILELQSYYNEASKPEFLIMNEHENTVQMMEKWDVDLDKLKADIKADIEKLQLHLKETIEQYGTGEDDEPVEEVIGANQTNG